MKSGGYLALVGSAFLVAGAGLRSYLSGFRVNGDVVSIDAPSLTTSDQEVGLYHPRESAREPYESDDKFLRNPGEAPLARRAQFRETSILSDGVLLDMSIIFEERPYHLPSPSDFDM